MGWSGAIPLSPSLGASLVGQSRRLLHINPHGSLTFPTQRLGLMAVMRLYSLCGKYKTVSNDFVC